eukprot:1019978-Prymnesium_polylepis.2
MQLFWGFGGYWVARLQPCVGARTPGRHPARAPGGGCSSAAATHSTRREHTARKGQARREHGSEGAHSRRGEHTVRYGASMVRVLRAAGRTVGL